MSNLVSKHYQALKPVKDIASINKLWKKMIDMGIKEQQKYWIKDQFVGEIMLMTDEVLAPNKVIEYVNGFKRDDSVTTLYEANILFGDKSIYVAKRREIIEAIAGKFLTLPSVVTIKDEGRGRNVHLQEMSTAQLLDTLATINDMEKLT